MLEPAAALAALVALLALGFAGWLASLAVRDVSIVDSLWSLLFLPAVVVYATMMAGEIGRRGHIVLALVAIWAVRLSAYITWRSHGQPEDRRYAAVRQRNNPGFDWKSLCLVFGLQAVLAWILAGAAGGGGVGRGATRARHRATPARVSRLHCAHQCLHSRAAALRGER